MEKNSGNSGVYLMADEEFGQQQMGLIHSDIIMKDSVTLNSLEEPYDVEDGKKNNYQNEAEKPQFEINESCLTKANANNIRFDMNDGEDYNKPDQEHDQMDITKGIIVEGSEYNQNQKNLVHNFTLIPKVNNITNKNRQKYTKAVIPCSINSTNMNSINSNTKNMILLQTIKDPATVDSTIHVNENSLDTNSSTQSFLQQSSSKIITSRVGTPISREYVALQRSVNESKILTEFVSDAASLHQRKSRNKEHQHYHGGNEIISSSQVLPVKKKRCNSRLSSTKDSQALPCSFNSIVRTNLRSNSVHSKSPDDSECDKIKKWTSEERILCKRSNMRSENSEFVIKQMDFLQRVFHSTEMPEFRRSCGRKSPNHLITIGNSTKQQKHSVTSKDCLIKRYSSSTSLNSSTQLTKSYSDPSQQNLLNTSNAALDSAGTVDNLTLGDGNSSVSSSNRINNDIVMARLKISWQQPPKTGSDSFCWKCHEGGVSHACSQCIRSFHNTCAKSNAPALTANWICNECIALDNALNNPKRFRRNELSLDMLSQLLSIALKHMKCVKGYHNFSMPYEVDSAYLKYIINPVTVASLQHKVERKIFRSAEEFLNETKWLLHNAYLLSNRNGNKMVLIAKSIVTQCRREITEIEACPECYLNSNSRNDWFIDVCTQPHLLLWAKLKGFPYWPAKAMGLSQISSVNVRFFGKHDRAFVSVKDCFLYSQQDPNTQTSRKSARELADCIKEVELHIDKIKAKVGAFQYAPFKTPYDPNDEALQLERMMPGVQEYIKRQQSQMVEKPPLQFKIFKTADNHLSIIQKANTPEKILQENSEQTNNIVIKKNFKNTEEKLVEFKQHENREEHSTPKYEVICKLTPDDNNTSKLNTVILKRKSSHVTNPKTNCDDNRYCESIEEEEASLAKLTKIMDKHTDEQTPLHGIPSSTYGNSKMDITVGAKEVMTAKINTTRQAVAKQKHIAIIKKSRKSALKTGNLKNIAKISNAATTNSTIKDLKHSTLEQNTKAALKEYVQGDKDSKTRKVNQVLKGLVPFLEIKQEAISDSEDNVNKQLLPYVISQQRSITDSQQQSLDFSNMLPTTEKQPSTNSDTSSCANDVALTLTITTTTTSTPIATPDQSKWIPLLNQVVKEEVLSENEEQNTATHVQNFGTANSDILQPFNDSLTSLLNYHTGVHVRGGTTIQRVASKNSNNSQTNYNQTINGNNDIFRRNSLKGIPHCTLPQTTDSTEQSSFPKSKMAKKAFPSTQESSSCPTINTTSVACLTQSSHDLLTSQSSNLQNLHPQRILHKNTMVTIPVDLASNKISVSLPPLAVVSTCFNTTCMHQSSTSIQSTSANIQNLQTITNASLSKTIPTNITTSITSSLASTECLTTLPSAAVTQQSVINNSNSLASNVPPPLAGLSGINYISSSFPNASINTNTADNLGLTHLTAAHILSTFVTSNITASITDAISRGPPKLTVRPNGPLNSDGSSIFPSHAGRFCKKLMENAHKLTDFFISVMEDTMSEMAQNDDLIAKNTLLSLELERTAHAHEQEIAELKRNSDILLNEMRKSLESEKKRVCNEIRRQCELERMRAIEETKRKQWCVQCGKEANMNCCWNTSYCDYPCQQLHWSRHANTCVQIRSSTSENGNNLASVTSIYTMNTIPSSKTYSKNSKNILTGHQTVHRTEHQHGMKSSSQSHVINLSKPISGQKDRQQNNTNAILPSPVIGTPHATEVLKLPSNTYLRPVTNANISVNSASTIRCNATYSIPIQRFNMAQLPITTPAPSGQQTFTIVQGANWVMNNNVTSSVCVNNSNNKITTALTPSANKTAAINNVSHVSTRPTNSMPNKSLLRQRTPTQLKFN